METSTVTDPVESLRRLTRTAPDPRVRRRAHAMLLVAEGKPVLEVARLFETAPHRVRAWRARFRAHGEAGLADEPRTGRPPKLDAAALAFLREALESDPRAYGLPVTVWSIRDLRELLVRRLGVEVCVHTVWRAVHGLGYRYRRPRHDLRHRQDREAVASARQVLEWLQGKAPSAPPHPTTFASSTSTSVRSTGTPGWRRSGGDGAGR
jgi:putative transposase